MRGRVYTQGTAVTVGLFLALVAVKFALGALAYVLHLDDGSGLGEVMVMIALMVGVQSQIVWTLARALGARATDTVPRRGLSRCPETRVAQSFRDRADIAPCGDLLP